MVSRRQLYSLWLCVALISCGRETQTSAPKIINPNGDSELALLMRDMFDDGMEIKADLLAGKKLSVDCDFAKIHSAEATEPEKAASNEYVLFAKAYENTVHQLENAQAPERAEKYQQMVTSCIQCHEVLCPGPIRKIKRMELTAAELERFQ